VLSKTRLTPGRPPSDRNGDGRGATTITWAPDARNDLAIATSTVLRPDFAGPPTMNAGMPSARSGP
jgi:hypothetical protein